MKKFISDEKLKQLYPGVWNMNRQQLESKMKQMGLEFSETDDDDHLKHVISHVLYRDK